MNFANHWFSPPLLWAANLSMLALLLMLLPAAWRHLRQRPRTVAAALLIMALCWSLRAHIGAGHLGGIAYHLLGLSLATLMLGPAAALWLAAPLMLAAQVLRPDGAALAASGLTLWCSALPPILVCTLLLRLARRTLPPNVFVYIFINGFLAAALGLLATGIAITAALAASGAFAGTDLWQHALPVFLLIAWGEAFLTGLLTAIFVSLAPQLLATFSDERYLQAGHRIWSDGN